MKLTSLYAQAKKKHPDVACTRGQTHHLFEYLPTTGKTFVIGRTPPQPAEKEGRRVGELQLVSHKAKPQREGISQRNFREQHTCHSVMYM